MKPMNKKIPGILLPPPKTEIDGKIADLATKTIPELLEILDRQVKLLDNTNFISRLPDKGAKVQLFHDKILKTLKAKQDEEKTCSLLANLKLDSINKHSMQNIEWEGKIRAKSRTYLDSDDDSEPEDVLQILSQSTSNEKKVTILYPETPLITNEDLLNIGEIPHIKYIVGKTEGNTKREKKIQFKPFKTTKSDVHNPEKEILRKKHKHWEVTAATPPPIVHSPAKELSLEESLKLQKDYNTHLKEVEVQHATQKLLTRTNIKISELSQDVSKFGSYRDTHNDSDSDESNLDRIDEDLEDTR